MVPILVLSFEPANENLVHIALSSNIGLCESNN